MLDFFVCDGFLFLSHVFNVCSVKNVFISSVNNATNFLMFKRNYNFDFNAVAFSIVEVL